MELDSYLSAKQKDKRRRRSIFLFAGTFLVLYFIVTAAGWIVLRSPLFRVTNIVVVGNRSVPPDVAVSLLQSAALRDHGFGKALLGMRNMLIWPSELMAEDLVFDPRIESIKTDKDYFRHTLTVNVVERSPFAIWCMMATPSRDERCFWFDRNGVLFQKAFDTQGSLMVAVHDYSQEGLGLNTKILPEHFTDNMISILRTVRAAGIDTKEIALKDVSLEEINVKTYDGPSLFFSLRFPADEDLPVLQNLMAKSNFGTLAYVDFRIEHRAYYK